MAATTKPKKCTACGKTGGKHTEDCVNYQCPKCKMLAGNHELSCPNHRENKTPPNGSPRRKAGTVDGKDAVIDSTPRAPEPPSKPKRKTFFPSFKGDKLLDGALDALQSQIDDGDFSGEKQQKDECEFESIIDGEEVKCGHIAVIPKMVKKVCPTCNHAHKETVEKFCLGHAVNVWGGGDPSRLQMELVPT